MSSVAGHRFPSWPIAAPQVSPDPVRQPGCRRGNGTGSSAARRPPGRPAIRHRGACACCACWSTVSARPGS